MVLKNATFTVERLFIYLMMMIVPSILNYARDVKTRGLCTTALQRPVRVKEMQPHTAEHVFYA